MARVLVLEEYRYLRSLYALELGEEGYEVDCAADREEAFRKLDTGHPDIIIVDSFGWRMDGAAIMAKIGEMKHRVPVILNTIEEVCEGTPILEKADARLTKSSDLSSLKQKVRELLAAAGTN